jgi:hypothetical protein
MLVTAEALAAAMAASFRDPTGRVWRLALVAEGTVIVEPTAEMFRELATALLVEAGGPDREFDI